MCLSLSFYLAVQLFARRRSSAGQRASRSLRRTNWWAVAPLGYAAGLSTHVCTLSTAQPQMPPQFDGAFQAVRRRRYRVVEQHLAAGCPLLGRDEAGNTLLHEAAKRARCVRGGHGSFSSSSLCAMLCLDCSLCALPALSVPCLPSLCLACPLSALIALSLSALPALSPPLPSLCLDCSLSLCLACPLRTFHALSATLTLPCAVPRPQCEHHPAAYAQRGVAAGAEPGGRDAAARGTAGGAGGDGDAVDGARGTGEGRGRRGACLPGDCLQCLGGH